MRIKNKPANAIKYLREFDFILGFFLLFQVNFNDMLYLAPLTTVSDTDLIIVVLIAAPFI